MTTIAYKDGVMMGDKQCVWDDSTPTSMIKVFKVKIGSVVFLVGFAGHPGLGLKYIEEFRDRGFEANGHKELEVMIVSQKGIWIVDEHGCPSSLNGAPHWAIGKGADFVMGALQVGATLKESMEAAAALDINTGMGFDTVSF